MRDPKTILRIASETCAGLGALHEAGIVHRDVAARNLLLDADGSIRVTDFGLARMVNQEVPACATLASVSRL